MTLPEVLLLAHAAATLVMVGVIWFVQVVHYPLFGLVGAGGFAAYESAHSTRIAALIALPWAVEGLTGLALLAVRPAGVPLRLAAADLALLGVAVAVTVLISAPQHGLLGAGFDAGAHRLLLNTNWLRTAAWTGCGIAALAMLAAALR